MDERPGRLSDQAISCASKNALQALGDYCSCEVRWGAMMFRVAPAIWADLSGAAKCVNPDLLILPKKPTRFRLRLS